MHNRVVSATAALSVIAAVVAGCSSESHARVEARTIKVLINGSDTGRHLVDCTQVRWLWSLKTLKDDPGLTAQLETGETLSQNWCKSTTSAVSPAPSGKTLSVRHRPAFGMGLSRSSAPQSGGITISPVNDRARGSKSSPRVDEVGASICPKAGTCRRIAEACCDRLAVCGSHHGEKKSIASSTISVASTVHRKVLQYDPTTHRMTDEHWRRIHLGHNSVHVIHVIGYGTRLERLGRAAGTVAAKAQRDGAVTLVSEEVQKVLVPDRRCAASAVNKQQRNRMRFGRRPLSMTSSIGVSPAGCALLQQSSQPLAADPRRRPSRRVLRWRPGLGRPSSARG